MKNKPKKIYLQIGEDCPKNVDFNDLRELSWCKDKIFPNDLEYINADLIKKIIKKINHEVDNDIESDTYILSFLKDLSIELQKLIES